MKSSMTPEDWQQRVPKNQKILGRNGGGDSRRIRRSADFNRRSRYRIDTSGRRCSSGVLGIESGKYPTGPRQLTSNGKEQHESET